MRGVLIFSTPSAPWSGRRHVFHGGKCTLEWPPAASIGRPLQEPVDCALLESVPSKIGGMAAAGLPWAAADGRQEHLFTHRRLQAARRLGPSSYRRSPPPLQAARRLAPSSLAGLARGAPRAKSPKMHSGRLKSKHSSSAKLKNAHQKAKSEALLEREALKSSSKPQDCVFYSEIF